MKKGFTLIELLAVIVILAIIALIATPIILNIISDSKKESNKRSIEMYAKALENAVAKYQLSGKELSVSKLNTTDGRNFSNINDFKVEYEGNVVCEIIEVYNDGNIYLDNCEVNSELVNYTYGVDQKRHLAKENIKALTEKTKTTGIVPIIDENDNIKPGSEFKIKVNDAIGELTFFVLSNEGEYVNLIAEQNITPDGRFTSEPQDGDEWCEDTQDNRYGPQNAYIYLSNATNNWTNIPIIENFYYEDEARKLKPTVGYQSVVTKYDKGKYITTINPYSSDYGISKTYENMRTRLPYYGELNQVPNASSCRFPLWLVNYTWTHPTFWRCYTEANGKTSSSGQNFGFWLLTSAYNVPYDTYYLSFSSEVDNVTGYSDNYGIRPVITILKSDLLRVM